MMLHLVLLTVWAWLTVGVLLMAAAYLGDVARGLGGEAYLRENWKGVLAIIVGWPWAIYTLHGRFSRARKEREL